MMFALTYSTLQGYKLAEGPMFSTARNMFKILYDRKVGAVFMLSGFMKNTELVIKIGKG